MSLHTALRTAVVLLLLAVLPVTASAQFNWMQPDSRTDQHLKAVDFASALVGYAAGDGGVIIKTTDGGATWTELNSTTSVNLWNIKSTGGDNVIAVGDNATILVSTDAGSTWVKRTSPMGQGEFLFGIQIYDNNHFYLAGGRFSGGSPVGAFMHSSDAGMTWTLLGDVPEAFFIDRLHFVSSQIGYAVGASIDFGKGVIVKTTDGGATWTVVRAVDAIVNSLYVHGSESFTAVGSPALITKTADGGVTWVDQASEITGDVMSIIYVSNDRGFVAGDKLLETTDGGTHWNTMAAPVEAVQNGIAYLPESGVLISVGNDGSIIRGASVNDVDKSIEVKQTFAWPNPASTIVHTSIAGEFNVTDQAGRTMLSGTTEENSQINVSALSAGLYWFTMHLVSGEVVREKIVIQ